MRPLDLRIVAALIAALLASPGRAQLGLDLTPDEKAAAEPKKGEPKKAGPKKPAPRKPDATRKQPAPPMPEQKAEPKPEVQAEVKPPPPAVKPAPPAAKAPVTMPELDVGARKGEAGKRVAEANKVFATGDYQTAALAYDAVLRDGALAEGHDEARYQLAKSLAKLDLNHAALARLDDILSKGPQGSKYFANALEWLFYVGKKTVNESVIVSEVARYAGGVLPPSQQDRFSYLLARYSFDRGRALEELGQSAEAKRSYDEARRLSSQVRQEAGARSAPAQPDMAGDSGDVYAKARFLDGLVQYAQGHGQAAVESFKEVVRLTNPRRGRVPDLRLRELAFLELARIHYEHKQNRYAIFYYDRMPWGGDSWLEGLWESSYAHYRIGNYEKALGNLLTLQSPYFRDEWFPESWILKAIIYYENCRYPEARAILDEFHARHEGVYRELDRLTAKPTQPAAFYEQIENVQKSATSGGPLMPRIMKVAFTDRTVKQLNDSILEVERETGALESQGSGLREAFRTSALSRDVRERLQRERRRLMDEAGARARAKLEFERDSLRDLLQQALRIKIEVARNEREALELSLNRGEPTDVVRNYRYSVAVSDEHEYWPYDGEFWRDELGTYTYTLTKGCRDTGARAAR
jgi:tetratricopeptide (TPR) repeat protein